MAVFGMFVHTRVIGSPWQSIERRIIGRIGDVRESVSHVRDQTFPELLVFFVGSHDVRF